MKNQAELQQQFVASHSDALAEATSIQRQLQQYNQLDWAKLADENPAEDLKLDRQQRQLHEAFQVSQQKLNGIAQRILSNNSASFVNANAPAVAFNTTGAYHRYRMTITPGSGARLFIEGNQVLSMLFGATGVVSTRRASFGDTSICQTSQTKLRFVSLTLPPQCGFDFNQDCVADVFDYLDFVAAFAANDIRADFNQDGVQDFFDYLDFVAFIAAGCA